ncbi:MAG TPA: hypothetical protein VHX38_16785 [Pseudonocardiaceae bacterium]|jgi:hypothetical protein|nr:hypothetical protein [Pseudonocardiaceae bacterium]
MSTPDQPIQDPVAELEILFEAGGWTSLPSSDGLIFIRPWPDGSVDSLGIYGAAEALAERTNPGGQPVWRTKGPLVEVIAAIRDTLPAPDAPDSPQSALAGRPKEEFL